MPPPPSYFQNLPNEVLLKILRFTDTAPIPQPGAPTALYCRAHLEDEDHQYELTKTWTPAPSEDEESRRRRATLYHSETSPFLQALQHHFVELWPRDGSEQNFNATLRTVQLGSYNPGEDDFSTLWRLRGLPIPEPTDIGPLLAQHGASIQRLVVASTTSYHDRRTGRGYEHIARQLESHCPEVNTLILAEQLVHPPSTRETHLFVRLFAARLHKLVYVCGLARSLPDLTACAKLRHLFVRVHSSLYPDARPPWASLGRTLRELHYFTTDKFGWDEVVDALAEHCPYLRTVELPSSRVIKDIGSLRYVEFLRTYRSQLVHAYVKGVSPSDMTQLREGCPNLRVTYIFHTSRPQELELVRAIGAQLDYFEVDMSHTNRYDPPPPTGAEYRDTMTHLAQLQQLHILDTYPSVIDYSLLRSLLRSIGSPVFERLHLTRFHFTEPITRLLAAVTSPHKLKALHLESSVEIESGGLFHCIATSNPDLEYATIAEARGFVTPTKSPEDALNTIETLVDSFSQCEKLVELNLTIRSPHLITPAKSEQARNAHHRARVLCRRIQQQRTTCVIILSDHRLPVTASSSTSEWDKISII